MFRVTEPEEQVFHHHSYHYEQDKQGLFQVKVADQNSDDLSPSSLVIRFQMPLRASSIDAGVRVTDTLKETPTL